MKRVEIAGDGKTRTYTLTDDQYQALTTAQNQQDAAFLLEFKNAEGEVTKKVVLNTRQILALEITDAPEPKAEEPEAAAEDEKATTRKTTSKT
ncbi:hypothetical protein [Deinococcus sp. Leaf326]|uniref:hypothetical protein n=1 Tax=Deinococcus sp. Leaf326 TaxID=1736338 RepID=UPI0006F5F878|nr:hypothetical protein [Deinococcus sp. Leaf326]KQR22854.1 hypothetical protein ASF71_06725 [Deinococcus sp. Leaf326]